MPNGRLLNQKLKNLPKQPGVYVFKDAKGAVLYVGKAVNLKNRVTSYFARSSDRASSRMTGRIELMISQIADLDYTVVGNELESLMLENNFIKQLKPKYNILLRDDKNYLFIKINIKNQIPTIDYARKLEDRDAKYFGPYTSSQAVKDTLRLMRKIFPYCANTKISTRPCFYYHIGKCPGVCFGKISLEEYRENYIGKIIKFLEGKQNEVLKDLQQQMRKYAAQKLFEKAGKIRDQIFAINRMLERQKIVYPTKISQDVFSLFQNGSTCVNLFIIREGKLIRKENFILENTKNATANEILAEFLPLYYSEATDWPKEIVLPMIVEGAPPHPKILVPSRGIKLELIKLGSENARQYLQQSTDKHLLEEARALASLKELQRVLNLPKLPGRIEAYDISNIQGTNPVGSMVVFDFARPKKDQYRKFKISAEGGSASGGKNSIPKPDDFAMMKEMLERRFQNNWPKPDLILVDGGKGQLNAALAVLRISNFKFPISKQIPIIGLAKRLEEIFIPNKKNPLILPQNSIALFLLQRIRDEAHRFAITYHQTLRSKGALNSILDNIDGIGTKKKIILLQKFGSTAQLKSTSLTDIANIVGRKLAEKIKASI